LHPENNLVIVEPMIVIYASAALFLVLSGFLLARPLLRRAR
jgi:hypothetical protein